jgi:hypothetical protein
LLKIEESGIPTPRLNNESSTPNIEFQFSAFKFLSNNQINYRIEICD